jgi:uncharacterized protein YfbU (UPF0304 family)
MKLSRTERWMLSNQYRILELLDKENADSHRDSQEALDSGYEMCYEQLCEHVYDDKHGLPAEECAYVLDVMSMYDALQHAYDRLDDKTGIEPRSFVFLGFDGNSEGPYMAFARYYSKRYGAFVNLRKGSDGFNSHMPTYNMYHRMIAAWVETGKKHNLTKDDLTRIDRAANHPSNR